VLLDVMMPGKSGFDVCQAVRADPISPASDPDAHREGSRHRPREGHALGADAYVTKPFSTHELAARVRELLAGVSVR
jgi:DNA-binding response OmpR family regulator